MHKDLKIGLILGLILVIFIGLRLVTDPRLSTKARMEKIHEAQSKRQSQDSLADEPVTEKVTRDTNNDAAGIEPPVTESQTNVKDSFMDEIDNPGISEQTTKELATGTAANNTTIEDTMANKESLTIKTQKFHIVQKGDTLSDISYKYYGTARKWPGILEANRDVLKDPNKLQLGMKLIIPEQ